MANMITHQDAVAGIIISILKEVRGTFEDSIRDVAGDIPPELLLGALKLTGADLTGRSDVKAALDSFAGWVLEATQGYASTLIEDEEPDDDDDVTIGADE